MKPSCTAASPMIAGSRSRRWMPRRSRRTGRRRCSRGWAASWCRAGFGERGIEGKILAAQYARKHKLPYLGLCLGMQIATIEFARNVLKLEKAHSTEFDPATPHPVIALLDEQKKVTQMGGTMRLGLSPARSSRGPGRQTLRRVRRQRTPSASLRVQCDYREQFDRRAGVQRHLARWPTGGDYRAAGPSLLHGLPVPPRIPEQTPSAPSVVPGVYRGRASAHAPERPLTFAFCLRLLPSVMTYSEAIPFLYQMGWFGAKFGLDNTRHAGRPGRESPGPPALHPRGRHQWQRLDLRHAGEHLPRSRVSRGTVHVAAPGLLSRTHPGQPPFDQRGRGGATRGGDASWLREFPAETHPTFFEVVTVMALRYFAEHGTATWSFGKPGWAGVSMPPTSSHRWPASSPTSNTIIRNGSGETLPEIARKRPESSSQACPC